MPTEQDLQGDNEGQNEQDSQYGNQDVPMYDEVAFAATGPTAEITPNNYNNTEEYYQGGVLEGYHSRDIASRTGGLPWGEGSNAFDRWKPENRERENANAWQTPKNTKGPTGKPIADEGFGIWISQTGFFDTWSRMATKTASKDDFFWIRDKKYPDTGKIESKFAKEVVKALDYLLSVNGVGNINVKINNKFYKGNVITDFLEGGKFYNKKKIRIEDGVNSVQYNTSEYSGLSEWLTNNNIYKNLYFTPGVYNSGVDWINSNNYTILYNPFVGVKSFDEQYSIIPKVMPPAICLLHEFAHIWLLANNIPYSKDIHEENIVNYVENPAIDLINNKYNAGIGKRNGYYIGFTFLNQAKDYFDMAISKNQSQEYVNYMKSLREKNYSRDYMTDSPISIIEVLPQNFTYLKGKVSAFEQRDNGKYFKLDKVEYIKKIDGE